MDLHYFFADPDPAVFLKADPDPGGKMNADPDPQPCRLVIEKDLYPGLKKDRIRANIDRIRNTSANT